MILEQADGGGAASGNLEAVTRPAEAHLRERLICDGGDAASGSALMSDGDAAHDGVRL